MPATRTGTTRRRSAAAGLTGLVLVCGFVAVPAQAAETPPPPPLADQQVWPNLSQPYIDGVRQALRAKTDLWGEHLMSQPQGPTYDNIKDYLTPIATGGIATGAKDTGALGISDTGYHYLPLTLPDGDTATTQSRPDPSGLHYALHTADGSGITADWHTPCEAAPYTGIYSQAYTERCGNFRQNQFFVGADGQERYGSNLGRLTGPTLRDGYLPVLSTGYRDASGVTWTQESFAARAPETGSLVSFVEITATGGGTARTGTFRLHVRDPKTPALTLSGNKLTAGDDVHLLTDSSPRLTGDDLTYRLDLSRGARTIRLVVLNNPTTVKGNGAALLTADRHTAARATVERYWRAKLGQGADISVPEPYAMDALRNLLIQNLVMGWRYSIGNFYDQVYVPEMVDTVAELGEFGFTDDYRNNMQTLVDMAKSGPGYPIMYRNWEQGSKLVATARYYRMTGDRDFVTRNLPKLRGYLDDYVRQIAADPHGILEKQRCCEDNWTEAYWTHAQLVSWWGWRDLVQVLREIGDDDLARRYDEPFQRFSRSLRAAVDSSKTALADGALFVPRQLLAGDKPYETITESKDSSYWNLLAYYGFASGFFSNEENDQLLKYVHTRGGTFLGLVRFNYTGQPIGECNPTGYAGYEGTGVDEVYGYQHARFLANNDEADRQVLKFYGQLAHGFSRGTFVVGEGANIDPCPGRFYRGSWLAPLSANNASFLKNLRELLVHEATDERGRPVGLRLAFATPRGWLADGEQIKAAKLPTTLGPVSYTITSKLATGRVIADLTLPVEARDASVQLRLRAPEGYTLIGAEANGKAVPVDRKAQTVELSGQTGEVRVTAQFRRG